MISKKYVATMFY